MEVFTLIVLLLDATLRVATPLILAALGGLFSERAGVVDIGLEGKMLGAAFAAAATASVTGSAWLGLFMGIGVSMTLAMIHAFACVTHRGDHVVSGVAINILVAGLTVTLGIAWFERGGQTPDLYNPDPFIGIELPGTAVTTQDAIRQIVDADPDDALRTPRQVERAIAGGDTDLAAQVETLVREPTPVIGWILGGVQDFANGFVDFVREERFTGITLPLADTVADVPILGLIYSELISGHNILVYFALFAVPITAWVVYRSRFGLRLRAVGENPAAVDTAGISVTWMRYKALMITGFLCGVAGTYLSTAHNASFVRDMTAGKGFLALAALIFAKWRPVPVLLACLLFGFLEAIEARLQGTPINLLGLSFTIPVQFIQALPYILTVVLLAGFIGKAIAPKAIGTPYVKER